MDVSQHLYFDFLVAKDQWDLCVIFSRHVIKWQFDWPESDWPELFGMARAKELAQRYQNALSTAMF